MAAHDDHDVDRPESDADSRSPSALLTGTVIDWLRFAGPARLLASAGVLLVLSGIGWWMLRSPTAPTESRLPLAGRAQAAHLATASSLADRPPSSTPAGATTEPAVIVVHVTGAVRSPGVYELTADQRVAHAIDAAGGALADADPNALNLAAPLADGDRIAVPTIDQAAAAGSGELGHSRAEPPGSETFPRGPVHVNTATVAELETLPGIGPATAAAIVEHREQHGPFASIDELEEVRGIGTAKLEAIRDHVTV